MNDPSIMGMVLLERYANDGSPTGLTWENSSSDPTCPRMGSRRYVLERVPLWPAECETQGSIPEPFDGTPLLFPVHPDCVRLLPPDLRSRIICSGLDDMLVTPTSSPRTVYFESMTWSGFLKLDYPLRLGRFSRELCGDKLWQGIHVSNVLMSQDATGVGLFHFPETGAIECNFGGRNSGALFRAGRPTGPGYDQYLPFPSLWSMDIRQDAPAATLPRLMDRFGGLDWAIARVVLPLVDSFWKLVTTFSLWPEAHAQNVTLGLNDDGTTGIIWRDCQGFRLDNRASACRPGLERCRRLGSSVLDASQRASYIYDWLLGHYIFDQIGQSLTTISTEAAGIVRNAVRERTNEALDCSPDLLPRGTRFVMGLQAPGGSFLPFLEDANLHYRG